MTVNRHRPQAVAFDVVETLFSLEPVAEALRPVGVELELFFTRLLRDGFALAASGDFYPFGELARSVIASLAPDATDAERDAVLAAFGRLPAHPDVAPALQRLHDEDIAVVALTNGGADNTARLLAAAGLNEYVEQVISIDEVRIWKPDAAVYRRAVAVLGLPPEQIGFVAVHAWDTHAAGRAGLTTGWCSRLEQRRPSVFVEADVTGADLVAVVDGLLALPVAE